MEKENTIKNFVEMIKKSWTFDKMTTQEQNNIIVILDSVRTKKAVKGTYKQRWEVLQAIYNSYLIGIGYNGFAWRETKQQPF